MTDKEHADAIREAQDKLKAAIEAAYNAGLRVSVYEYGLRSIERRDACPVIDINVYRPL